MFLDILVPTVLKPGDAWVVAELDLPAGVAGLPIGEVVDAVSEAGRQVRALVDTVDRRGVDDSRQYRLVILAERIAVSQAQRCFEALVDHVVRSGESIVLTRHGQDVAVLVRYDQSAEERAAADAATRDAVQRAALADLAGIDDLGMPLPPQAPDLG